MEKKNIEPFAGDSRYTIIKILFKCTVQEKESEAKTAVGCFQDMAIEMDRPAESPGACGKVQYQKHWYVSISQHKG